MSWKIVCVVALVAGVFMTCSAQQAGMKGLDLWVAGGLTMVLVFIVVRVLRGVSRS